MEYIVVKSQAELDAVPVDTDKIIRIEFGTTECPAVVRKQYRHFVNAYGNSTVEAHSAVAAYDKSTVEVYGNNIVIAWDNSSVEAYDKSTVKAQDSSTVKAYDSSSVEAYNNSRVEAQDNSRVEARDSSSVVAWGSSTVKARGNSIVEAQGGSTVRAFGSSTVTAWDSSSVIALENSIVVAQGRSSVAARGNSRVEAQDRSSVEAWGNVQICKDKIFRGEITTHANARVVDMPESVGEFLDFFGVTRDESAAVLYKAVHKLDDGGTIKFVSDYDKAFEYKIGNKICSNGFDMNSESRCSQGIHAANLNWALNFGAGWDNLAILELKVNLSGIVIPDDSNGEVRVPEAFVVREVPLEECGIYGKILARRRKNSEMRNSN